MPKSSRVQRKGVSCLLGQQLPLGAAAAQLSQRHGGRARVMHFSHLRLEPVLLPWFQAEEFVQVSDCSDDHRHWNTLQDLCVVARAGSAHWDPPEHRICDPISSRLAAFHWKALQCYTHPVPQLLHPGCPFTLRFHLNSSCFFLNPTLHMPLVLRVPAKYLCWGLSRVWARWQVAVSRE